MPLSTHANGLCNSLSTVGMLHVLQAHAEASFTMGLHCTERYLQKHRTKLMSQYLDGAADVYTGRLARKKAVALVAYSLITS